jgi:hypothetical protein
MRIYLSLACTWLIVPPVRAADTAPVDFNRDIRPLLADNCFKCHGPDEKTRKAKLRLDDRDEAIAAGAFVPGKPESSEILSRVVSADPQLRMPPPSAKKPPLTPQQVELLRRWIVEGARYSEHWSFARLTRPPVPKIDRPAYPIRNPIDSFILYRLQQEGVKPAPEADKITLIRRLSFDLTGLPPSPEDVRAFVNDPAPDAYEKWVDKLLASPHHAERLAVWWLDLVRYADSIGYHSDNPMNVSPFRDYVIRSFSANKPFDQFTIEQLAGDLLPNPTLEQKIGASYNRLLQTTEEGGAQAREYEAKYAADRVRNFGQVWLGGTLMCAECHNHKFDPYTMTDFYSVAAFFADIQEPAVGSRGPGVPVPINPEQEARLKELNEAVSAAEVRLVAAARDYVARADAFSDVEKWPTPTAPKPQGPTPAVLTPELRVILAKKPAERKEEEIAKLVMLARTHAPALRVPREALAAALKARTDFENTLPRVLMTVSGPPRVVRILPRGNWLDTSGPVVEPNTPAFLPPLPPKADPKARYTRLDLAKWTVSPDNPLTPRVTVNRLWRLFFGRGIARSLEESGTQGDIPTHPELLDWLASEFLSPSVANGQSHKPWDIRHLVRLMVTSSTYRRSSIETPELRSADPANRLFSRQNRERLAAEFVRDTALAVSGLLNRQVGGPSVKPYQPPGYWSALNFPPREWQNDSGDKLYRRGMYTHWQRSFPHPAMVAFDAPSREECTCERPRSNIPQQALVLLNDPEFVEAARVFAQRTIHDGGSDDRDRIRWAFERATSRYPRPEEAQVLLEVLQKHRAVYAQKPEEAKRLLTVGAFPADKDIKPEELAAWTSVCRVILNLHETITRP